MTDSLAPLLENSWATLGDRVAIYEKERHWSGKTLLERARVIESDLEKLKLEVGEPVLLTVGNRAADFAAMQAIWKNGGVVVPVHTSSPSTVVSNIQKVTGARILVDGDGDWSSGAASLTFEERKEHVTLLAHPAPPSDPLLIGAAMIVFTSGSTGLPKGVVLSSHGMILKLANNANLLSWDKNARTLLTLQITFSFGTWVSLLALTRGTLLVVQDKFRPKDTLETILHEDINRTALIPTMFRSILSDAAKPEIAALLSSITDKGILKDIYTGGEVYNDSLAKKASGIFPSARIINIFGLTETGTCDLFLTKHSVPDSLLGNGGAAPGVNFRIVDENGNLVPEGETGELQIRSESGMKGYLGQPELTSDSFQDGYFRTGDLAQIGENGLVAIVGRSKEMISRGGNKIYPQEIEAVILNHSSVSEALATGVADPLVGERIHVAVVLAATISVEHLREWARKYLDKFKVPDAIHVVDALPVGNTGKADRRKLRALISEGYFS